MLFRLNLGYERDTGSNSNYCRSVSKRCFLPINPFVRSSLVPLRSSLFCCSFRPPTLPYILNDVFFFLLFHFSFSPSPFYVRFLTTWITLRVDPMSVGYIKSEVTQARRKKKVGQKKWGMQSQFHYGLPDLPCCRQAQRLCRKMRGPCLKGGGGI